MSVWHRRGPVSASLRRFKVPLLIVAGLSGVMNLLALVGTFYMLQIYDRVLPARSVPTLAALSLLACFLFATYGLIGYFRGRAMVRIVTAVTGDLEHPVARLSRGGERALSLGLTQDLDRVRSFFCGQGFLALLDLPWVPLYLGLVYLLHPVLGLFVVAAMGVLLLLAVVAEFVTRPLLEAARDASLTHATFAGALRGAGAEVRALGVPSDLETHVAQMAGERARHQLSAHDRGLALAAVAKVVRLGVQSGSLGLGALLVIDGELSAGAMMAASLVAARALMPLDALVSQWQGLVAVRCSLRRLEAMDLEAGPLPAAGVRVGSPPPQDGGLTVSGLTLVSAGRREALVREVSFSLQEGEGLGIIGPMGAGKSCLVRALAGALPRSVMRSGVISLGGRSLECWTADAYARSVGYMPQVVELAPGTIADSISGFRSGADGSRDAVVQAAQLAGVHEAIEALASQYETRVGPGGVRLPAGFVQRLGLARALYGEPRLVVLDEPQAHLDGAGEAALIEAVRRVRGRGGMVLMVAHRVSALAGVDRILALGNGAVTAHGLKSDVLRRALHFRHMRVPEADPARSASEGGAQPLETSGDQAVRRPS